MPVQGEGRHEDTRAGERARSKGVRVYGDIQQECRNIHQGVQGAAA